MSRMLTLIEAAAELRKSKRWLGEWLRSNPLDPIGVPYYFKAGRTHLFRDADVLRIRSAIANAERRSIFFYFVEVHGHIKIGIATKWKKRLSALQVSSPFQIKRLLVLDAYRGFERELHEKFAEFHVRGEWFKDSPEIREFIAKSAQSSLAVVGGADQ
jgi:hypothetical protein